MGSGGHVVVAKNHILGPGPRVQVPSLLPPQGLTSSNSTTVLDFTSCSSKTELTTPLPASLQETEMVPGSFRLVVGMLQMREQAP